MKRTIIIAAALLAAATAKAQTVTDPTYDFQSRTSIGADWKISKGLHLEGEYEMRTRDSFSSIARHQASLGLSYKFGFGLKAGIGYTFIYHHKTNAGTWTPRHRFTADLGYTFKAGDWRIGLKEQLRITHKTESLNEYEGPVNPITLKSRIKLSYKGFKAVEPYAFVEARNFLNAAGVSARYSTATGNYDSYEFLGYGLYPPYVNRVRGALGLEWKLSKHHALDFYLMEDYCYERNIDISKDRTRLKSFTYDTAFNTIAGIGYKLSF